MSGSARTSKPRPFDDIRVRQAIRFAVDIDAILQGAYAGIYPRANSLLAPSLARLLEGRAGL